MASERTGDISMTFDLTQEGLRPYFIWDEDLSVRQLRGMLADPEQWRYYAAKIMREARYEDVWKFLSLKQINESWESLRFILGRRRGFWEFLFAAWKQMPHTVPVPTIL